MIADRRDDADEIARFVEGVLEGDRPRGIIARLDMGHRHRLEILLFLGGTADVADDPDFHLHIAQLFLNIVERDDHMAGGGNILAELDFRGVRQVAGEIHRVRADEQAAAAFRSAEPAVSGGRRATSQRKGCDH